jgi:hypothetical protein
MAQSPAPDLTTPLPLAQRKPLAESKSHEERRFTMGGVRDVDPNIYAYSAEFAQRFQMPEQWIAPDLKGAEAVAFRVVPTDSSCGWGGNRNACKHDETVCRLDVYFDHRKHPLPWDARMRGTDFDWGNNSASFVASMASPVARPKGGIHTQRDPFTDPQTGKELQWQYVSTGWGYAGIVSYDREIFTGLSMMTVGADCSSPTQQLWLASQGLNMKDVPGHPALKHLVYTPASW